MAATSGGGASGAVGARGGAACASDSTAALAPAPLAEAASAPGRARYRLLSTRSSFRFDSRSAIVCRLSTVFFPRPSATSTLARPPLK